MAQMLDVQIALNPGSVGLSYLPVMTFGAGLCAASFAFASYAPLRSLLPIGLIGALGEVAFYFTELQGFGTAWASAVGAVLIGVVSYSVEGRVRVPPLLVVVSAIVPLLPGLAIYRSLSLMADGDTLGILAMVSAIAVASGVILGEYIAQPLKREVRRLEDRLSGPRLVGQLRARAIKRDQP